MNHKLWFNRLNSNRYPKNIRDQNVNFRNWDILLKRKWSTSSKSSWHWENTETISRLEHPTFHIIPQTGPVLEKYRSGNWLRVYSSSKALKQSNKTCPIYPSSARRSNERKCNGCTVICANCLFVHCYLLRHHHIIHTYGQPKDHIDNGGNHLIWSIWYRSYRRDNTTMLPRPRISIT